MQYSTTLQCSAVQCSGEVEQVPSAGAGASCTPSIIFAPKHLEIYENVHQYIKQIAFDSICYRPVQVGRFNLKLIKGFSFNFGFLFVPINYPNSHYFNIMTSRVYWLQPHLQVCK